MRNSPPPPRDEPMPNKLPPARMFSSNDVSTLVRVTCSK